MQYLNKIHRTISLNLTLLLIASLITFPSSVTRGIALASRSVVQDQQPKATETLERGYRTGYSDGYQSGYSDSTDASSRDFRNKEDYQSADRTYSAAHGSRELFRDGYRQGYEAGYETGYERRPFNSTAPASLELRSALPNAENITTAGRSDTSTPIASSHGDAVVIPPGAMLLVQLETNMSTNASQPGDRIQARVMNPIELEGAMLHGILKSVRRPGRVRGNSLLQVAFEEITLPNGRSAKVDSQIVEVVDAEERGIGEVDDEGGIHGKDSTKGDVAKVGTGAIIGGIIGAIAGGGKGAAIGSTVGGAAGAGRVLSSRGEDVSLRRGDQLRVRTGRTVSIQ